ncbi:MAG: hypothetical protein HC875_19920 [Anaerolineales bacterium]|nr:hypothetical protein [Anaerolineales bacterium]
MKSRTTERFRKAYANLPEQIQSQVKVAYQLFSRNPYHPSLHFKQVHSTQPIYSARISLDYRVLGVREGEELIWFWVGSHEEYNKLLSRL